MLGNAADNRPLEEMVPLAQRSPALDDDMAFQNAMGTDGHVIFDNRERSNLNAVAESCRGSDQRQGVNSHNGHLERAEEFSCGQTSCHLDLTVFIGQRNPVDWPDYDRWSRFAIFLQSPHEEESADLT